MAKKKAQAAKNVGAAAPAVAFTSLLPKSITLHGPAGNDLAPLWTAEAEVLETMRFSPSEAREYAYRHLYVAKLIDSRVYPSVAVIRARITCPRILIFGPAEDGKSNLPGFSEDRDEKHFNVTMLVSAPAPTTPLQRPLTVLAGVIDLDMMALEPWLPGKEWNALFPMFTGVKRVRLCGSGVLFEADAKVPWQTEAEHGQFLAMMRVPQPGLSLRSAKLHVGLERDEVSLTPADRSGWQTAFGTLGQALQPSLNRPQWAALKLHLEEHGGLPPFHWDVKLKRTIANPLWKLDEQAFALDKGATSLLLTDRWPEPETLGKVLPDEVTVKNTNGETVLEFDTGDGRQAMPPRWLWNAVRSGSGWDEVLQLEKGSQAVLDVDAIALAQALREETGEPSLEDVTNTPANGEEPLLGAPLGSPVSAPLATPEPLLWMNLPLQDGWTQLPYFNLTPTTYVDAELPTPPKAPPQEPLMQGAWRLHADPDIAARLSLGAPDWSLTVLDMKRVEASFKLDANLKLLSGKVTIEQPLLSVVGLWSRSRERGTVQNMLPEHEDWVGGLVPLVMRTPDPSDITPSPYHFEFDAFEISTATDAQTSSPMWAMTVRPWDTPQFKQLIAHLEKKGMLDTPGVWRRHRVQPLAAALPLAANEMPPAHPALSRELIPFALPGVETLGTKPWKFARASGDLWPTAPNLPVEPDWPGSAPELLPMIGPMFPGLVVGALPATAGVADDGSAFGLQAALRWDMPVMDERHAMAVTPPLAEEKGEAPPTPKESDHAAKPLRRRDLKNWWERQRMRAVFARADAREMFEVDGGQAWLVNHLVEPLTWKPATPSLSLATYPGKAEMDGKGLSFTPTDHSALEGISDNFKEGVSGQLSRDATGEWHVHAGAADAIVADQRLHDQRGLTRAAPQWASVAKTEVGLRITAKTREDRTLWTPLTALPLKVGNEEWFFWCRDLPLKKVGNQAVFERGSTAVNEPTQLTREQNWLQTREWRLASTAKHLKLLGLRVHGLQLMRVTVDASDKLLSMEVLARLQLPLTPNDKGDPEQWHRQNTVTLIFDQQGLADVRLAKDDLLDWPLSSGETPPRVTVGKLTFDRAAQTLKLEQVHTHFSLLGQTWKMPMNSTTLKGDAPCELTWTAGIADLPLVAKQVKAVLNHHADAKHSLLVTLLFSWGGSRLVAEMTHDVLNDTWECVGGLASGSTLIAEFASQPPNAITSQHLRLTFDISTIYTLDALPGMRVSEEGSSGCAAMGYTLTGQTEGPPTFKVSTAFMELLLPCEWGAEFVEHETMPTEEAMRSSRGSVSVNYTLTFTPDDDKSWRPALLLNGQLTLRSLMSWPVDMLKQPGEPELLRLYFEEGSSVVSAVDTEKLKRFADWLKDPNALLRIEGYASADGTDDENETHARQRAEAVLAALLTHVSSSSERSSVKARSELIGWGERRAGEHPTDGVPPRMHPDRVAIVQARPVAVLPPATGPRYDHISHEMTVLFNQHLVDGSETLIGDAKVYDAQKNHAVLFAPREASDDWSFVATTEHCLRELGCPDEAGWHHTPSATRRWTACQELRLLTPACMVAFVNAVGKQTVGLSGPFLSKQAFAHLAHPVLTALAANASAVCTDLPGFWIEASAPFWVRALQGERTRWTPLQSLPGFEQQVKMARLQDYLPRNEDDSGWQLVVLPFLGRMQPHPFDQPFDNKKPSLTADPLWQVITWKDKASTLARMFASRGADKEVRVPLPALSLSADLKWPRLEPAALADSWLRLQVLPDETTNFIGGSGIFAPVLASLPAAGAARVTRMVAMAGLLSPSAEERPPGKKAPKPDATGTLPFWWRPGHLLAYQGPLPNQPTMLLDHPMVVAGAAVLQLDGNRRVYVAATVLAAQPRKESPQPLSLAVTPCLSLRQSRPASAALRAVYAEFITQGPGMSEPKVTATRLWAEVTEASAEGLIQRWADETRLTTVPKDAWWLVRVRKVLSEANADDENKDLIAIIKPGFSLGSEEREKTRAPLTALRAEIKSTRRREYHASKQLPPLPGDIAEPWEAAGMLTAGVQSVWRAFDHISNPPSKTGLSATRYVMQLADQDGGQPGGFLPSTEKVTRRWWLSLGERVQYFHDKNHPTLPNDFTGHAIPLLTPVADDGEWDETQPKTSEELQSLIPTTMSVVVTGRRPGVFRAVRPHLATQVLDGAGSRVFTSAGPLVQHRFPRGLPLPPDWQPRAHAHSDSKCRVMRTPCESFTFVLLSKVAAEALAFTAELTLAEKGNGSALQNSLLGHGILIPAWNGELIFDVALHGTLLPPPQTSMEFVASCMVADQEVSTKATLVIEEPLKPLKLTFGVADDPVARLKAWQSLVKSLPHGSAITITLSCPQPYPQAPNAYRKAMSFHFRLAQPEFSIPPLSRVAVHFEDPAYNRRLSSPPAQDECALRTTENAQAMLASDRRQYNANSTLLFGVRLPAPLNNGVPRPEISWELHRNNQAGQRDLLSNGTCFDGDTMTVPLSAYLLRPGDILDLTARQATHVPRDLRLELPIVSQPVIPTPEAAYAAIMFPSAEDRSTASCPRFAWSPMPQRIELLDSQDLFKSIVRRVASFRWWVPVRSHLTPQIQVQRTDALGNTHAV